jgi:hypothetical protein
MALLTAKQQRDLLIAFGLADFVAKGKITAAAFDAAVAGAKLTGRATRAALTRGPVPSIAGSVARAAVPLATGAARAAVPLVTNPYLAGAALGYGALQTEPGQELMEMAEERGRRDRMRFEQALTDLQMIPRRIKAKSKSTFNKAVSAGMTAVKKSPLGGPRGMIKQPKTVFTQVTKMASKLNKAKKLKKPMPRLPKSNIAKVIYKAIVRFFRR